MAKVIAQAIRIPYANFDMVIPVPSVEENDLKRTFNPVQTVLEEAKIPFQNCLKMNQRPKQFSLNLKDRINLENGISIQSDIQLENKHILLVDDIYTTGQTAHNVAVKLFSKKVRKLSMLTFAR
ncbi:ComF family protein [Staphylococcus chromogenes]|uniref:ComF family protein n=1 Tax=Staphylococcus chromogenes TaxID=46126 RepID=UPI0034DAE2A1